MNIKLTALKLPKTTGVYKQLADRTKGDTLVETDAQGTTIDEVFWQENTVVIGGDRLGIVTEAFIATRLLTGITPSRGDYIKIDDIDYEVQDFKREKYSHFEDHYEFSLYQPADANV